MDFRFVVLIVLLLCPSAARAQATITVGPAFPVAPESFTDVFNAGFGLSGSFRLPVYSPFMAARLTAGFDVLQVDEDVVGELQAAGGGGDLSTITFGFDALFMARSGRVKPYIAPFAGLSIIAVEEFSSAGLALQDSETAFTTGGAAGLAFRLPSGLHLVLEARVLHALRDGNNITWIPIHAGVAFDME